ncbi:hypothetical protein MPLA_30025 [Mesorhizobium sp. ORS 3359]|nr:hypothetical protein MPLA_30025 [Mesorhizobium sp. ORS 3359]
MARVAPVPLFRHLHRCRGRGTRPWPNRTALPRHSHAGWHSVRHGRSCDRRGRPWRTDAGRDQRSRLRTGRRDGPHAAIRGTRTCRRVHPTYRRTRLRRREMISAGALRGSPRGRSRSLTQMCRTLRYTRNFWWNFRPRRRVSVVSLWGFGPTYFAIDRMEESDAYKTYHSFGAGAGHGWRGHGAVIR